MERVGGYEWLYGSVGAVLGFMLWAWVSAAAVLVGAVLNAELERQAMSEAEPASMRSQTSGPSRRGAVSGSDPPTPPGG